MLVRRHEVWDSEGRALPEVASNRIVVGATIPMTLYLFHRDLVHGLVERGWDVTLATDWRGSEQGNDDLRVRKASIPMTRELSPFGDALALNRWVRLIRGVRPLAAFVGTPKAGLLAMIASRLTQVPVRILVLHGMRSQGLGGWRRQVVLATELLSVRLSTHTLSVSPSLSADVVMASPGLASRLTVLGHGSIAGVDCERFRPPTADERREARDQLGVGERPFVIGFLGRLAVDKGVQVLLEAVGSLHNGGRDVVLLLVGAPDLGDSPDDRFLRQQLAAAPDWVIQVGWLSDVTLGLHAMDVLALPTRREGFGVANIEAASCGLPVITTNVTGARDSVVDGETGLLIPAQDAHRLQHAITSLMDDPGLCQSLGRRGRERVLRDFSSTEVAGRILDFIEDASRGTVASTGQG